MKVNESEDCFDDSKLVAYLKQWNYNPNILTAPIMNKDDIRNYSHKINSKDVFKSYFTGGSTGEPLKLFYSKNRSLLRTASILYYNKLGGYNSGDRYLFIRSKPKSKIFQIIRNEILFVPNDLSHENICNLATVLVKQKVQLIIGYPSVIYELSVYLSKNTSLLNKLKIKSFISNSEPFENERRDFIKSILNCNMIDRYSNEENGVIAQQRVYGGDYIVDRYNLYVEVINPLTCMPVREGESGKVVITDVCNDLFPMIRYDTGDYAIVSKYRDNKLWSIKSITGRVVDTFYNTKGVSFSPLMLGPYIRLPISKANINLQFQFSQVTDKKYRLKLKSNSDLVSDSVRETIVSGLKSVIGEDAEVEIVFVEEIEALPSGKRPLYRNEIKL